MSQQTKQIQVTKSYKSIGMGSIIFWLHGGYFNLLLCVLLWLMVTDWLFPCFSHGLILVWLSLFFALLISWQIMVLYLKEKKYGYCWEIEIQRNRHKQSANGLFFHLPADSVGTWGSKACSIPSSATIYNSKKLCETKGLCRRLKNNQTKLQKSKIEISLNRRITK